MKEPSNEVLKYFLLKITFNHDFGTKFNLQQNGIPQSYIAQDS